MELINRYVNGLPSGAIKEQSSESGPEFYILAANVEGEEIKILDRVNLEKKNQLQIEFEEYGHITMDQPWRMRVARISPVFLSFARVEEIYSMRKPKGETQENSYDLLHEKSIELDRSIAALIEKFK